MIKKDLKMYSINPLYLIFGKVNGYFEDINGNKNLTLVSTDESKEKKYEELWIKIRDLIGSITENVDDYKSPIGPKPFRIRFAIIYGFIMSLNGKIKH